jgi:hypothetical protein
MMDTKNQYQINQNKLFYEIIPEGIRQNSLKINKHCRAPKCYQPENEKSLGCKEKKLYPDNIV